MVPRLEFKSASLGALLAIMGVALLGADKKEAQPKQVFLPRFLVLESTSFRKPANGLQAHLLKVSPHYGKIDSESLKLRLEAETQEIKMIVTTDEGYEFRRGDIIGSDSLNHLKLSPGSKVVRHLPSGGHELVP